MSIYRTSSNPVALILLFFLLYAERTWISIDNAGAEKWNRFFPMLDTRQSMGDLIAIRFLVRIQSQIS